MTDEQLKTLIDAACLASAQAMGDKVKTLSWFGRNVRVVVRRAA